MTFFLDSRIIPALQILAKLTASVATGQL